MPEPYKPLARARKHVQHKPGVMNRTEEAYSKHLQARVDAGEVHRWWFEAMKLRVAYDACWITFDFLVQLPDGTLELHDSKGGPTMDDASVKEKVITDLFPFRVFEARKKRVKDGGGWLLKEIGKAQEVEA